jgi:hypothetical protein
MGGRGVVGVGVGAHQASSGRVGVDIGPSETRTGSMVGVRPSKASTGGVMGATSRQPRTRRMPKPSSRMGSSVAGVGMLSSSYLAARRIRVIIAKFSFSSLSYARGDHDGNNKNDSELTRQMSPSDMRPRSRNVMPTNPLPSLPMRVDFRVIVVPRPGDGSVAYCMGAASGPRVSTGRGGRGGSRVSG